MIAIGTVTSHGRHRISAGSSRENFPALYEIVNSAIHLYIESAELMVRVHSILNQPSNCEANACPSSRDCEVELAPSSGVNHYVAGYQFLPWSYLSETVVGVVPTMTGGRVPASPEVRNETFGIGRFSDYMESTLPSTE
jgi:hypothetical protein